MKCRLLSLVRACVVLALLSTLALSGSWPATAQARTGVAAPAAPSPSGLIFVENAGQFAGGARFQVRTRDLIVWLAEEAIWLTVPGPGNVVNVRLSFPGANRHPRLEAFNPLETRVSYFAGNDPAHWRAGVPAWGGVRYLGLYPGIDLELGGEGGALVPRLVAQPGADLNAVRMRVEGAREVTLADGALLLGTAAGQATWPLLRAAGSSAEGARISTVQGAFEVRAPFAAEGQPLAGAPAPADDLNDLLYSTFLGGSGEDWSYDIAVDENGSAYVTGETWSSDFPTTPGALDMSYNFGYADAFIAKVNPCGSALEYATFLGGRTGARGFSIAVDESGAAYVTGDTWSTDFPTTSKAYDEVYNGGADAFVAKLSPTGASLEYATYLGGNRDDSGRSIALDDNGTVYVTGTTWSANFPTTPGAHDLLFGGAEQDAFVVKLIPVAEAGLEYATYLGGADSEEAPAIAVDGDGRAYITGATLSADDFPVTDGAYDIELNAKDAFVARLNATGSALEYATFLGGTDVDTGNGIAVDGSGAAYVVGDTWSADFPVTEGAFDTTFGDCEQCRDAFVAKLNAAGTQLDYATFVGGNARERGQDIAVDGSGSAFVTGTTWSTDFPTTDGAFDDTHHLLSNDAFLAKINADATNLDYGSFLGGSGDEWGAGIALDGNGAIYLTGQTVADDFTVTSDAIDTIYNGAGDGYVVKLATEGRTGYCISGHVSDNRDLAVFGVVVSAGSGGSGVTNANGNYAISDVITGTYTLTPTLGASTFDPITRTVQVPPDAAGQDFQVLPLHIYLPLVRRN